MIKLLTIVIVTLAGIAALYFCAALVLTFWPASIFKNAPPMTADEFKAGQIASGVDFSQPYAYDARRFKARDGAELFARVFEAPSDKTILMLHGVASEGTPFNRPAGLLREAVGARVIIIDLRGHGRSSGRPWSVDHVGQYEEDVADVVAALRKERPAARIVLAGHSMGGGIALRYALSEDAPEVDAYLLIAPLLGSNAPTMMTGSPAGAPAPGMPDASELVHFRAPRFFGVLMLNIAGITAFNQMPILYFNHPPKMPGYGFAALSSMQPNAPEDYRAALGAIKVPLLVVAGSKDESFRAEAYPEVIKQHSRGETRLIEGASHSGVLSDPRAIDAIKTWLDGQH